jgi:hypothetical protein
MSSDALAALQKIADRRTVVQECLERVAGDFASQKALLDHGLATTAAALSEAGQARGSCMFVAGKSGLSMMEAGAGWCVLMVYMTVSCIHRHFVHICCMWRVSSNEEVTMWPVVRNAKVAWWFVRRRTSQPCMQWFLIDS